MELPSLKNNVTGLLLFYVIALGGLIYVENGKEFRSGPCTPNLDIFAPILLLVVNVILLLISLLKDAPKRSKYPIFINLGALAVLIYVLLKPR